MVGALMKTSGPTMTHQPISTRVFLVVDGLVGFGWVASDLRCTQTYNNLYLRQAKKYFKKICPPDKLAEFVLSDFFTNSPHPFNLLTFFCVKLYDTTSAQGRQQRTSA